MAQLKSSQKKKKMNSKKLIEHLSPVNLFSLDLILIKSINQAVALFLSFKDFNWTFFRKMQKITSPKRKMTYDKEEEKKPTTEKSFYFILLTQSTKQVKQPM